MLSNVTYVTKLGVNKRVNAHKVNIYKGQRLPFVMLCYVCYSENWAVNRRVVSSSLTCGANLMNELRLSDM